MSAQEISYNTSSIMKYMNWLLFTVCLLAQQRSACQSQEDTMTVLRTVFDDGNLNDDKFIDEKETIARFQRGCSPDEDCDVTCQAFYTYEKTQIATYPVAHIFYETFDGDHDNLLTKQEMQDGYKKMDADGDGKCPFDEFAEFWSTALGNSPATYMTCHTSVPCPPPST